MAKRILLAGVLGGVALFLWGGLSHMVLGLGEVGVQSLPQQQPAVDAMKASIGKPGLFYFPQGDGKGNLTPTEANGPWGILIYHPSGASLAMSRLLIDECILNIVQALIVAFLLSLVTGPSGYLSRLGCVAAIGVLAAIGVNTEYWIWYGFPANYTVATIADKFIGFLIVGLIVAALVKPMPARVETVLPARAA